MAFPQIMRRMPNLVCACVDKSEGDVITGRLYNMYSEDAYCFTDITDMLSSMEKLYDKVGFPQATVKSRSFRKSKQEENEINISTDKVASMDDIMAQRGQVCTFAIAVSSRARASWQGVAYWFEKDAEATFNSDIELIKLIHSATK